MIYTFGELKAAERLLAGGKGAVLAQLYQLGGRSFRVPNGFVITPEAFEGERLRIEAWEGVRKGLAQLRAEGAEAFAVRSSALREDGAVASFAGGFESVLDVQTNEEVRQAIGRVYASRLAERVQAYSQAHGLGGEYKTACPLGMAVVVQRLVKADLSGVLFTADPITGSSAMMIGNAVYGLGEQLVSGEVNPLSFTLQRPKGAYDGPADIQPFAHQLYHLGERLEERLSGTQDIEWAIADGKLYLLQSRPITTRQAHNPVTGEWNDSYLGDYLWTNTNFGEALPDVMTPFTWSIMQVYLKNNALGIESERFPFGGNIGGRFYMNVSFFVSLIEGIGLPRQKMLRFVTEMFGALPPDIKIPTVPFSRWHFLRTLAPQLWRRFWLVKQQKKQVPTFIARTPAIVAELSAEIEATQTKSELLALWNSRLQAHLDKACQMLAAGTSDYKNLSRQLHIELEGLVGEADANALMSGISNGEGDDLASLGPLLGLTKVAQGEMSRAEYIQHYGHRGAHELELSKPRPAEEAGWLEHKLTEIKQNKTDVRTLLTKQHKQHQSAWERFKVQYPHKANSLRQRLNRMAEASKSREATRSEVVRMFGLFRAFALRVGALTGLREHIFFLSLPEQLAVLAGDESSSALITAIPARKETYARYCALPPYPTLINGRFDPFQWACNQRRHDIFDAHQSTSQRSGQEESTQTTITGFAGAAGIVEGTVCILHSVEEGHKLFQTAISDKAILVTTTTNIGWTPLFPHAAAIITDVGAPLSHAAIVARELGIPAVVGCTNATMLLKDGDHVRVNGGAGIVEKLAKAL